MQGVLFLGEERVSVGELPDPRPAAGEAQLRVTLAALCGSELGALRAAREAPTGTGHECVGVIEDPGDTGLTRGARVAVLAVRGCGACEECAGGHFPYCFEARGMGPSHVERYAAPARNLLPIPDHWSDETALAVFGCGIGVAYHGCQRIDARPGDTVLVVGAGPIGLSAALVLRHLAARVLIADVNLDRLRLAQEITDGAAVPLPVGDGIDFVAALRDANGGERVAKAFLASGAEAAVHLALDALAPRGTLAAVGAAHQVTLDFFPRLLVRDRAILGSWHYHAGDYAPLVALVDAGLPAARIITHRFSLDEAPTAYRLFVAGKTGKAILNIS